MHLPGTVSHIAFCVIISVIEPVSADTRLIISKDNNTTMPKFFADVTLQEIEILLSRQQVMLTYDLDT